jgi:hypothetical protein
MKAYVRWSHCFLPIFNASQIAQIVIYITFGAAVVIETGLSDKLNSFFFGLLLCAAGFMVITVALGLATVRANAERRQRRAKLDARVAKLEWACNFTPTKVLHQNFSHLL